MGLCGGGSGTSTSTMRNIPEYAVPYVQSYLIRANSIAFDTSYNSYFTAYTGSTYADLTTKELNGITAMADRGRNGSAIITKGNNVISDITSGTLLPGNDAKFQAALTDSTNKPSNTFESNIRNLLGATLYLVGDLSGENIAFDLTSTMAARYNDRAAAVMYKTNYDNERRRQNSILNDALIHGVEDIKNAELLRKAGLTYRIWLQGKYEDNYRKFFEGEVLTVNRTEILGNSIRALVGTQRKTVTQFQKPSMMGSILPLVGMAAGFALTGGFGALAAPAAAAGTGAAGSAITSEMLMGMNLGGMGGSALGSFFE